jgi:hypothetical protein
VEQDDRAARSPILDVDVGAVARFDVGHENVLS